MALSRISDFDSNYRQAFDGKDLKGMGVYAKETEEKIGTVSDALVDEQGQFRYFVLDISSWTSGKQVLLPVGRSRLDQKAEQVYVVGLSRQQAEYLPKFDDRTIADYDHEERVREVYRTPAASAAVSPVNNATAPLEVV